MYGQYGPHNLKKKPNIVLHALAYKQIYFFLQIFTNPGLVEALGGDDGCAGVEAGAGDAPAGCGEVCGVAGGEVPAVAGWGLGDAVTCAVLQIIRLLT